MSATMCATRLLTTEGAHLSEAGDDFAHASDPLVQQQARADLESALAHSASDELKTGSSEPLAPAGLLAADVDFDAGFGTKRTAGDLALAQPREKKAAAGGEKAVRDNATNSDGEESDYVGDDSNATEDYLFVSNNSEVPLLSDDSDADDTEEASLLAHDDRDTDSDKSADGTVDESLLRTLREHLPGMLGDDAECTSMRTRDDGKIDCVFTGARGGDAVVLVVDGFFGRVLHVRNDNVDAPQIVAELREYGMPRVSAIGDIDVNRLRRIGAQTAATPTAYWQAEGRVVSILNEHFVYVEKVPRFGGGAGVATRGEKSFEWLTEKQFQAKFKEAPKLAVLSPEAPQEVLDGTLAIGEKHLIRRSFADVWLRSEGRATCSEPCFAPFVPQSLSNLLDATGDAARPRAPAAPAGKLNTYCDFAVSYDSVAYLHTDDGSWLRPALPLLFHVYHVFAGGVWEHFVELLALAAHMLQRPYEKCSKHLSLQNVRAEGLGRTLWGDYLLEIVGAPLCRTRRLTLSTMFSIGCLVSSMASCWLWPTKWAASQKHTRIL